MKPIMLSISVGLLALLASAEARAHDPDTGQPNWITDGGYSSPQTGQHCCGPQDCDRLDSKLVQATPKGFILHAFNDELVPYSEATPSEDGKFWRCHMPVLRRQDGSTIGGERRCFFAPVGTE